MAEVLCVGRGLAWPVLCVIFSWTAALSAAVTSVSDVPTSRRCAGLSVCTHTGDVAASTGACVCTALVCCRAGVYGGVDGYLSVS